MLNHPKKNEMIQTNGRMIKEIPRTTFHYVLLFCYLTGVSRENVGSTMGVKGKWVKVMIEEK